jgi:protocatechuate 3,4-dioxygenase beta subunit
VSGHPMRLGMRVIDAACAPVAGAVAEVWHADATGDDSAFEDGGNGKDEAGDTTFLRGAQTTDATGIVEFTTIYPGRYRGRSVHVHVRVHLGDATDVTTVLTTQLFFDDDVTAAVFSEPAYPDNGLPDTATATDRIAGNPRRGGPLLALTPRETPLGVGTVALVNLGVRL